MSTTSKHPTRLRIRGLQPSATLSLNERCDAMLTEGQPVYKLGLGQSPFPVPDCVAETLRSCAGEKDYQPIRGLDTLRHAIAHDVSTKSQLSRTHDDVLVGPGSKALFFMLQLVWDGELVIPAPSRGFFLSQARIAGRQIRFVQTRREDQWLLMPSGLEAIAADGQNEGRIVMLSYPHNPTGGTYKIDDLKGLAHVARERGLILLSDESYGALHHKGQHVSIARYYPEGTIVSTGLSKWCGADGWRLGAFVFPESLRPLLDAMAMVASESYSTTSSPIQHAAVRAFEGGEAIERYLVNSRRVLSALGRWCARKLRAVKLKCPQPVGGFYLFADFSDFAGSLAEAGIRDSRMLSARILEETGVATLPGAAFGRPPEEFALRLAYVDFDGARALEAVSVIPFEQPLDATFLKRHCPRVVRAIELLCAWHHERFGNDSV